VVEVDHGSAKPDKNGLISAFTLSHPPALVNAPKTARLAAVKKMSKIVASITILSRKVGISLLERNKAERAKKAAQRIGPSKWPMFLPDIQ
jgi:hypothetical protein